MRAGRSNHVTATIYFVVDAFDRIKTAPLERYAAASGPDIDSTICLGRRLQTDEVAVNNSAPQASELERL